MIDFDRPPPTLPTCDNGHVACVQATTPDGEVWCWGWHLLCWVDDWQEVATRPDWIGECIDRLQFMLVSNGVDTFKVTVDARGVS